MDKTESMLVLAEAVDVSHVPTEISILPLGVVESSKGDFKVDDESVELILQNFKNKKIDLVIDYEHQTLNDTEAPAAGWIKDIQKGQDAIVAKVEWTPRANEYLKNKEYKYLSPVVSTRRMDRRAVNIQSVALTNTPAIIGMIPIVNSADTILPDTDASDDSSELFIKLKTLLQLPDDTDEEELFSKLNSIVTQNEESMNELENIRKKNQDAEVNEVLEQACKDGKILSYMIDDAKKMAEIDLNAFKEYIDKAPQVISFGKMDIIAPENIQNSNNKEINDLLGITSEDNKRFNY